MATELTPFERDILRLRLGLDNGEGKKIRQIVEICGGSVTVTDVRNAERRALKKLKSPASVHTHNLLSYLDMSKSERDIKRR
jgi:DNA-directed RNA polymerase sigma subunit (sigma70/sigma32)